MAIAFVQKSSKVVTSGGSTLNTVELTGVSSGACLVLTGSVWSADLDYTISVSDGSAYTVRQSLAAPGVDYRQIDFVAYLLNASSGTHTATVTVTNGNSSMFAVCGLAEFSGVKTSAAEDTWDNNDTILLSSNDVSAGPITTTDAGALIVGTAGFVADSTTDIAWGDPSGWQNLFRQSDGYTTGTGHDSCYWLPGSIQTNYTAQWSHRNTTGVYYGSGTVVALLPAAASGPSIASRMALLGVG